MEGGLPMLNCLLQHTLRSLCSSSDSTESSNWVYAVFWRILPRNYPPPKWENEGSLLDRSKANKRNWILVWEDGFCNFFECERAGSGHIKGRFGADVFFKMSHEVYNYGEGLVGKVAAEESHKWVFREISTENSSKFISSWNGSLDPQPKAWEFQFKSGIQTIAIISVREGIVQLGSLDKILEDLNLVVSVQRKFSYLHTIPGVFSMQRPYLTLKPNQIEPGFSIDDKRHLVGGKRCSDEKLDGSPIKFISLGLNNNNPQTGIGSGSPFWPIPTILPTVSCSFGALLSKLPFVIPSHNAIEAPERALDNNTTNKRLKNNDVGLSQNQVSDIKLESCFVDPSEEEKLKSQNPNSRLVRTLGFGPQRESALNRK